MGIIKKSFQVSSKHFLLTPIKKKLVVQDNTGGNDEGEFSGAIFIYIFVTVVACIICFNLVLGVGSCNLVWVSLN